MGGSTQAVSLTAFSQFFLMTSLRDDFKYYLADFVRKWGTPPPLRKNFGKKGVTDLKGYPRPPLYGIFPGNLSSKLLKMFFLLNFFDKIYYFDLFGEHEDSSDN